MIANLQATSSSVELLLDDEPRLQPQTHHGGLGASSHSRLASAEADSERSNGVMIQYDDDLVAAHHAASEAAGGAAGGGAGAGAGAGTATGAGPGAGAGSSALASRRRSVDRSASLTTLSAWRGCPAHRTMTRTAPATFHARNSPATLHFPFFSGWIPAASLRIRTATLCPMGLAPGRTLGCVGPAAAPGTS